MCQNRDLVSTRHQEREFFQTYILVRCSVVVSSARIELLYDQYKVLQRLVSFKEANTKAFSGKIFA